MSSETGKEDRKTLCNLMKMLEQKKEEAVNSRTQRVASRERKTTTSPQSKPIRKRTTKRKPISSTQTTKISRWLTTSPIEVEDDTPPPKKKHQHNKNKPSSKSSNENSTKEPSLGKKSSNKTKTSKVINKDYSYDEKYGVLLPSYEKILKDRKNFAEHKQQARELKELLDGDDFKVDFNVQQDKTCGKLRDCKHLTHDEIVQGFNQHCDCLEKIMNGDEFSMRHEKFHDFKLQQTLTGSSSMLVFNDDQISQMVGLLRERFDPDNTKTRYFFQVLVPELTFKIFMCHHEMSLEEATEYLDNMPL